MNQFLVFFRFLKAEVWSNFNFMDQTHKYHLRNEHLDKDHQLSRFSIFLQQGHALILAQD